MSNRLRHNIMKPTVFIAFILATGSLFAQVDKKIIKQQAELTAAALLKGDYETVIRFTYPKIVEMLGGREKMIDILNSGRAQMEQQGMSIQSVTFGEPSESVAAEGGEIHCLVPQTLFVTVPAGKMKAESWLLAISTDKGANWYFLDTAQMTMDNIKNFIPHYNPELKIPEKKAAEFIGN